MHLEAREEALAVEEALPPPPRPLEAVTVTVAVERSEARGVKEEPGGEEVEEAVAPLTGSERVPCAVSEAWGVVLAQVVAVVLGSLVLVPP